MHATHHLPPGFGLYDRRRYMPSHVPSRKRRHIRAAVHLHVRHARRSCDRYGYGHFHRHSHTYRVWYRYRHRRWHLDENRHRYQYGYGHGQPDLRNLR